MAVRSTYVLHAGGIPMMIAAPGGWGRLDDAPVAFRRPPRKNLANSVELLPGVGLRIEASSFGPRLSFRFLDIGQGSRRRRRRHAN